MKVDSHAIVPGTHVPNTGLSRSDTRELCKTKDRVWCQQNTHTEGGGCSPGNFMRQQRCPWVSGHSCFCLWAIGAVFKGGSAPTKTHSGLGIHILESQASRPGHGLQNSHTEAEISSSSRTAVHVFEGPGLEFPMFEAFFSVSTRDDTWWRSFRDIVAFLCWEHTSLGFPKRRTCSLATEYPPHNVSEQRSSVLCVQHPRARDTWHKFSHHQAQESSATFWILKAPEL